MTGEQALWLSEAAGRLYSELDPAAEPMYIAIGAASGGQYVIYALARGQDEIHRWVIPDAAAAHADARTVFTRHVVDATPPQDVP